VSAVPSSGSGTCWAPPQDSPSLSLLIFILYSHLYFCFLLLLYFYPSVLCHSSLYGFLYFFPRVRAKPLQGCLAATWSILSVSSCYSELRASPAFLVRPAKAEQAQESRQWSPADAAGAAHPWVQLLPVPCHPDRSHLRNLAGNTLSPSHVVKGGRQPHGAGVLRWELAAARICPQQC